MAKSIFLVLLLSFIFVPKPTSAQDAGSIENSKPSKDLDVHEKRFAELSLKFETARKEWWATYQKATKEDKKIAAKLFESHPYNFMVPDFLELEAETRGTKVGFSCLYHLVIQAASVAVAEWDVTKGKQRALKILGAHYCDYPDVDTTFRCLFSGARIPESKIFLRDLIDDSNLDYVKANAIWSLANNLASEANYPAMIDSNILILDANSAKDNTRLANFEKLKADLRDLDVKKNRHEARVLIEIIAKKYSDILESPRAATKKTPAIISIARSNERRLLLENLAAVEFELKHGIGQKPPEINQKDAFGKPMRLAQFQGKVVVLMFSFKGCGPCERMYPENRELIKKLEDAPFVFLGVMGDEKIDTVIESVDNKTITWRVWWDGKEKTVSRNWNIRGWPETYVIDKEGFIRFRGLRGNDLANAVKKLLR